MKRTGYPQIDRLLVGQLDTAGRNDVTGETSYRTLGGVPLVVLILVMHVDAEILVRLPTKFLTM